MREGARRGTWDDSATSVQINPLLLEIHEGHMTLPLQPSSHLPLPVWPHQPKHMRLQLLDWCRWWGVRAVADRYSHFSQRVLYNSLRPHD